MRMALDLGCFRCFCNSLRAVQDVLNNHGV